MDWHIDRNRHEIARARDFTYPVERATFKARDSFWLDLYFNVAGVAGDLPSGSELVFALKSGVESDATLYAFADDWTLVEVASGHYRARISLNTVTVVADIADLPSIPAVGEISWSEDGVNWESSNTVAITIVNDIYKGSEGTPEELPTPEDWLEEQLDALLGSAAFAESSDFAIASVLDDAGIAEMGLYASSGNKVLDWELSLLSAYNVDIDELRPSHDWANRTLYDMNGDVLMDYSDSIPHFPQEIRVNKILNSFTDFETINTEVYSLVDGSGNVISLDWSNRQLNDASGILALDWSVGTLNDNFGSSMPSLDWNNRQLLGTDGTPQAGWNEYGLNFGWDGTSGFYHTLDGNGINTPEGLVVDLGYKQLKTSGSTSMDWSNRQLNDASGMLALDWSVGTLNDNGGSATPSVDWVNRQLIRFGNNLAMDWDDCILYGDSDVISIDYNLRYLSDNTGFASLFWHDRYAADSFSQTSFDWENRQLLRFNGFTSDILVDWGTNSSPDFPRGFLTSQPAPLAADPGVPGQMVFTDGYTYRCYADGDWRREATGYATY